MHSGFTVKWALLLLLTGLYGDIAAAAESESTAAEPGAVEPTASKPETTDEESEFISLSAEDAAGLKSVLVYIAQEQTTTTQAMTPSNLVIVWGSGITNLDLILTSSYTAAQRATLDSMKAAAYRKAVHFPPEGRRTGVLLRKDLDTDVPHLKAISKSLEDGVFIQSVNQTIAKLFEGKTWFENVEISMLSKRPDTAGLQAMLTTRQKKGTLPDGVAMIRNWFVLSEDFYKLWFITEVEIYKVRTRNSSHGALTVKPIHRGKFASLYDLRDDFNIVEPEKKKDKFIAGYWTRDNGKLYYGRVAQLASENAKMVKRFLLDQPPSSLTVEKGNAATMALYKINEDQPETKRRKKPEKKISPELAAKFKAERLEKERLKDGQIMRLLNPLQRKAYMFGKEYENVCVVNILESAPDRLISRDQDVNIHYSLPVRDMKLAMENEIDADEYMPMVQEYQEYKKKLESRERKMESRHKRRSARTAPAVGKTDEMDQVDEIPPDEEEVPPAQGPESIPDASLQPEG